MIRIQEGVTSINHTPEIQKRKVFSNLIEAKVIVHIAHEGMKN